MSGGADWEPFEIGEGEYAQLAEVLKRASYRVGPRPPAWVEAYSQWAAWCLEGDEGGPLTRRYRPGVKP